MIWKSSLKKCRSFKIVWKAKRFSKLADKLFHYRAKPFAACKKAPIFLVMGRTHDDDTPLTEEEIAQRRDKAILRALKTPPKRREAYKGKSIRQAPKTAKPNK